MKIRLEKFKTVESTNDVAHKLIKKNISTPTLIFSKKQTKGRGTMGKKWISLKGNIFLSILLIIDSKKINFKQYALLNAYLIRKILSKYLLNRISIKWPNDLLIEKKKVCGILQEFIKFKDKEFLIIGVGINTSASPNIKNYKTTSMQDFTKKKVDNERILKDFKKMYEKFIKDVKTFKFLDLKRKYK